MSDSKATTAEPVAWMVWQPMGGPARFTTDAKGVADLQSRADMTVTPLVRYDQAAALLQSRDATIEGLRAELAEAKQSKDGAYLERNQCVAALTKCFPSFRAKTAIEGWSEDWHGVVYIDLPTGQASWHYHDSQGYLFEHLPFREGSHWDGHDTPEKYRRLAALLQSKDTTIAERNARIAALLDDLEMKQDIINDLQVKECKARRALQSERAAKKATNV